MPFLTVFALCLTLQRTGRAEDNTAAKRQPAPEWKLNDVEGKAVSLSDFKGKVIILDFWATWCPPCREEIPGFVELQKKFGHRGLVVIGVSLDEQGVAVVRSFVKQNSVTYPVVMATDEMVAAYGGIEALPTTFIIDREGKLVKGHRGFAERTAFETDIEPLL